MTRAPRSRKKKPVPAEAGADAAIVSAPVPEGAGETLTLPLAPAEPEVSVSASEPQVALAAAPQPEPETEPVAALDVAPVPAAVVAVDVRSSMRIEVTEERSAHLGQRLRAAREVRGWSREDVAHRLHVPTTVVADIEAERYERLGAPIYVRGYLSKYAALVGLPPIVVNRVLEGLSEPDLKASTEAPPAAPTWERYRVAVIGGLITLAVAIPMLTLVANRGINAPVPQVRSLDEAEMTAPLTLQPQPAVPAPVAPVAASTAVEPETVDAVTAAASTEPAAAAADSAGVGVENPPPEASDNPTLMASMAGFSSPPSPGTHVLEANFREDSWIEIFDAEGRVIEQNLVRAGQARRYQSTGAVSVKIGNVGGVDLRADGNSIDLAAHARANVARLRLFEPASAPTP